MNKLKFYYLFLGMILAACSSNSITSRNAPISNGSTSIASKLATPTLKPSINNDDLFLKSVHEDIINDYKVTFNDKALLKINLDSQLNYLEKDDLINAGKLTCKVLDNIKPSEDKFNPNTMRGIAKDTKHPGVYTKIREYLDPQLKFNSKDLDYVSLNSSQQLAFLGLVPHIIANNVVNNSLKYYCSQKQ